MLQMAVGQTEEIEGRLAAEDVVRQCSAALEGAAPQCGLVLASHDLELHAFLTALQDLHPGLAIVGGTTVATMSSAAEYVEGATTLTLFASDVLDFRTGVGTGVADDPEGAVNQALSTALEGSAKTPALCIVIPTVESLDPAVLTDALARRAGKDVVVWGGGTTPDFPFSVPWRGAAQFHGDRVLSDSLPLIVVSGPLKISLGVAHGWQPVGRPATVTKARGDRIYEIDGKPITSFYERYVGDAMQAGPSTPFQILDEESGHQYLRAPIAVEEDGSVLFLGSVPEGATVQVTVASTTEILAAARSSLEQAVASFPEPASPEAVLVSSCAVRSMLLGTNTGSELSIIRDLVGRGVPVSGFYANGEIAPLGRDSASRFHNETCCTLLLGT